MSTASSISLLFGDLPKSCHEFLFTISDSFGCFKCSDSSLVCVLEFRNPNSQWKMRVMNPQEQQP